MGVFGGCLGVFPRWYGCIFLGLSTWTIQIQGVKSVTEFWGHREEVWFRPFWWVLFCWLYHSETCHDISSFRSEMEKVYSIQFNFRIPPHFSSHTLYILLYIYIFIYIFNNISLSVFLPLRKKNCILYTVYHGKRFRTYRKPYRTLLVWW